MVDIIALRESYKRRKVKEIHWISGNDNVTNAITKAKPNRALEAFVNTNKTRIRLEG